MESLHEMVNGEKIAYFSMEIGLMSEIPTYSGGLGVIAGDTIRASADLKLPLIATTLVSKKGYFRQKITAEGKQIENTADWEPSKLMELLPTEVNVQIQNRDVKIKSWLYAVRSFTGGKVPVLFLDTDIEGNLPEDREITSYLYGGDERYRLKQEIVLGIGGARMLDALGFKIRKYHMNEGHSSLLALELLNKNGMEIDKVRELCIFTTHTPVEAAYDVYPYNLVEEYLGKTDNLKILKRFSGGDRLNMTLFALNLSNYVNGVAKRHCEVAKKIFPGYVIHSITNGVDSYTWTCESFRKVFNKYIPSWAREPELLVRADNIPDEEIWNAHMEAKKILIDYINKSTYKDMNYDTLTLGFARRATGYKRANLLFSNVQKLLQIHNKGALQIVYAGKAHLKDGSGKGIIEEIFRYAKKIEDKIKVVYLEEYNMELAGKLVSGVDVWLNTPLPPLEASGTSGMKAAHNGVINFSVLDGWWIEGWIEGVTGWAIGPHPCECLSVEENRVRELEDLYNKLEYCIVPTFYQKRDEWIKMMKNSIGKIAYYFNSHRMMRRYFTEAYL